MLCGKMYIFSWGFFCFCLHNVRQEYGELMKFVFSFVFMVITNEILQTDMWNFVWRLEICIMYLQMLVNSPFYVLTITNAESLRNFGLYRTILPYLDSVIVEITDSNKPLNRININFELLLADHVDWSSLRKLYSYIWVLKISVSWDVMLCGLVGVYQASTCCSFFRAEEVPWRWRQHISPKCL
jgi:hypothetical protein